MPELFIQGSYMISNKGVTVECVHGSRFFEVENAGYVRRQA